MKRVGWRGVFVALLVLAAATAFWWSRAAGIAKATDSLAASSRLAPARLRVEVDAAGAFAGQRADRGTGDRRDAALNPPAEPDDPNAQLALWKRRLARAEYVERHYRTATRYPHESRPLSEHTDQTYPNRPILETKKLARPGEKAVNQTIRINTSQERIFVVGNESVLFTLSAMDGDGNALPLIASEAMASDPPESGKKPSKRARVALAFNDLGLGGDSAANDGILSLTFTPAKQGFAEHTGPIRLAVLLKVGDDVGTTFFDLYYTPVPPVKWAAEGLVREALENGSLNLYLNAEVHRAGRYVITGRVDDARGKPFALAVFNDEVSPGKTEFKLTVFGKLIRDIAPAFPLTLRDIDGFLLKPDAFPDRDLVPRLQGKAHTTRRYQPDVFSDAEWQSEERERHLREFANDIAIARDRIAELSRAPLTNSAALPNPATPPTK